MTYGVECLEVKFLSIRKVGLISYTCLSLIAAEPVLDETRSTIAKWVEARQLISRTRLDWQSDKEMLEQNIALFERELKDVSEAISKVGTSSTQVGKEREQSETGIKLSNEALDKAKQFAGNFESQLVTLVPRLPMPLQEILQPLLNRLPADRAMTKMAATERAQVLVAILNEVDKFNNSVSIFNEKRKNEKLEEIAVETVYIGLGVAYFVNGAGDFAGIGAPGNAGWEWTNKSELGTALKDVVRIYRNEGRPHFVSLPVSIK